MIRRIDIKSPEILYNIRSDSGRTTMETGMSGGQETRPTRRLRRRSLILPTFWPSTKNSWKRIELPGPNGGNTPSEKSARPRPHVLLMACTSPPSGSDLA
jgi:hypothetical protein